MAKSREKVNKNLGFWDNEVTIPEHDEICLWAYRNAESITRLIFPEMFDQPWLKDEVRYHWHDTKQNTYDLAKEFTNANPRPNPRIKTKTLEYVLKRHTGYQERTEIIVGYADLLIETESPIVIPVTKSGNLEGFCIEWNQHREAPNILVEAKTVIPSLGELLRQINLYRTAFNGRCVVVSPDDTFADILAEQNVTFIKYVP